MTRMMLLAGLLVAVVPPAMGASNEQTGDLGQKAYEILKTHCSRCHGDNGTLEGGMAYVLDRRQLVARQKVLPGEPTKSPLLQRILKGEMPPSAEKRRPSPEEQRVLEEWIKAGAPHSQADAKRSFVTAAISLELIAKDLAALAEDDQPFIRYFTLTHRYNAGDSDGELEAYRQALSKLVNSLSWSPRVVTPSAIDPARTVFRIDLRDYKWSKRTWGLIAGAYPYAIVTDSAAEQKCREATQTDHFQIRADWFAVHVTRADTYYQILQLPLHGAELKKLFGVANDDGDLTTGRIHRAGFLGSRVTPAARLIERHESHFGGFWIATSFPDKKHLFEEPLASAVGAEFPRQGGPPSAIHTTQQVLFHLPNGLLGYMIWDPSQKSTDVAKGIQDVRRKGAGVQAPLSCMSCHTEGVITKDDEVQSFAKKADFPKATLDKIAVLYPSAQKFAALVAADAERFQQAVKKTGAAPGTAEPIAFLALRHEENLGLSLLAAELGLTPKQLQEKLQATKFAKLAKPEPNAQGIKRQVVIDQYGELAQSLGLGKAPSRIIVPGTPLVFAEMLQAPSGIPTEAVAAKKADPLTTLIPGSGPSAVPNHLQVLTLRGHLVCRFPGYRGEHHAVAISPKDQTVASESQMGIVTVYDPVTAEKRFDLDAHKAPVTSLDFSPDGKLLATAGLDGTIKLWRATSGLLLNTLPYKGGFATLKFSADGKTLAAVGDQPALWIMPIGQPIELKTSKTGSGWTRVLAISLDHQTIAAMGSQFGLWDVKAGRLRAPLKNPPGVGVATVAAFSPDGKWLASAGVGQGIVLWDLGTFEPKTMLRISGALALPVNALAFSADSKWLISGAGRAAVVGKGGAADSLGGEVRVWDLTTDLQSKVLTGHTRAVTRVAVGAEGKVLVSAGLDGTVRLWSLDKDMPDLVRKTPAPPFEGHFGPILCARISRDERQMLTGGADGTVRLWNAQSGAELKSLARHTKPVRAVAFTADGAGAVSAGDDLKLVQWDLANGIFVKQWDLPPRTGEMLFSGNGKYLAVGTADGLVGQINTASGKMVRKLDHFGGLITALAFSADDQLVAVSDSKRSVGIWDLGTEKVRGLRGMGDGDPNHTITALAFSPNAELLVSGSGNARTAGLWDLKTGAEIHRVGAFPGRVADVLFATDGRSFFVASGSAGVQVKTKLAVVLHASITQVDAGTGQALQFWDQFTGIPLQIVRTGQPRQLVVVVGDTLMRLSTENGKTISLP